MRSSKLRNVVSGVFTPCPAPSPRSASRGLALEDPDGEIGRFHVRGSSIMAPARSKGEATRFSRSFRGSEVARDSGGVSPRCPRTSSREARARRWARSSSGSPGIDSIVDARGALPRRQGSWSRATTALEVVCLATPAKPQRLPPVGRHGASGSAIAAASTRSSPTKCAAPVVATGASGSIGAVWAPSTNRKKRVECT
jgi:hypothetical protein